MGYEKINRITKKKDGVYISTKSSNDSAPFRSYRIDFLSEDYKKGEDIFIKTLLRMFTDNCEPSGWHKSISPFRNILRYGYLPYREVYDRYRNRCDEAWNNLTQEDKDTRWKSEHTPAMIEYLEGEKIRRDEYIDDLYMLYKKYITTHTDEGIK